MPKAYVNMGGHAAGTNHAVMIFVRMVDSTTCATQAVAEAFVNMGDNTPNANHVVARVL